MYILLTGQILCWISAHLFYAFMKLFRKFLCFLKRQKENSGNYPRTLLTLVQLGWRTHLFCVSWKTVKGGVWRALPWGLCSRLLSFPVLGLCCQWSLKTIRLLSSSKEPPAQLVLEKPLLDIYNPTVKLCLVFPQWLFEVSEFAWCQLHTQMYLHCFFSLFQSGCGRSVNPTIFSTQSPVRFLLHAYSSSIVLILMSSCTELGKGHTGHLVMKRKILVSLQSEISSSFS